MLKQLLKFPYLILSIIIIKFFSFYVFYLMLMMVDPHVHFHVLPRYREPRMFAGTVFEDFDWPAPPDVLRKREVSEQVFNAVREEIISGWAS